MQIKRLQGEEILEALHLVWEVFAEEVATYYTAEGVAEFQKFIKFQNFMPRVTSGEVIVFGVVSEAETKELCGVGAIRGDGHILLLYVRKKWQKQGVAQMLVEEMHEYVAGDRALMCMTVNASPNAYEAYRHLGFQEVRQEQMVNGIPCILMSRVAIPKNIKPDYLKRYNKLVAIGVVAAIVMLAIAMGYLVVKTTSALTENANVYMEENYNGENIEKQLVQNDIKELEKIKCYEDSDLAYTIKEENYTYQSEGTDEKCAMEFHVSYPQLEGIDNAHIEEINALLKDCAMSTVDAMYLNPSDNMKNARGRSGALMESQVTYRVTYAGKDFISVVFFDRYYVGNPHAKYEDLRTRNIRLSDGSLYETADIVKVDDEFVIGWLSKMKEEFPKLKVFNDLSISQFRKILEGEILDNRYYAILFLDAEGINIGITYHYTDNERNSTTEKGWAVTSFGREELTSCKTDSEFWNLV